MKKLFVFVVAVLMLSGCSSIVGAPKATPDPTEVATTAPTAVPTEASTQEPTYEPTPELTLEPTEEPTEEPTPEPTPEPTRDVGARLNPYKLNQVASLIYSGSQNYSFDIVLKKVVRGKDAWTVIHKANQFNEVAPKGQEYIIATFEIKITKTENDEAVQLTDYDFCIFSGEGAEYERTSIAGLKPEFKKLYSGASCQGVCAYLIDSNDASPKIALMQSIDGGIWFDASGN